MYHHESEEIYKLLNYDAILFDVDGTLIDSAPGIINTLKEVFARMGVDTTNVNLRRYLGPPLRKSFGEHFTDPALIEKGHRPVPRQLRRQGQPRVRRLPRCRRDAAAPEGCGPCAVHRYLQAHAGRHAHSEEKGLAGYFDFIGGASMDESRDTKTDVVRHVLAQPMMQGRRVLMVGDRNDDMRGAADCGLDAAGALYGYGSREELEPFHPVLLAESCASLADQILNGQA